MATDRDSPIDRQLRLEKENSKFKQTDSRETESKPIPALHSSQCDVRYAPNCTLRHTPFTRLRNGRHLRHPLEPRAEQGKGRGEGEGEDGCGVIGDSRFMDTRREVVGWAYVGGWGCGCGV